jgi:hypothetical protein
MACCIIHASSLPIIGNSSPSPGAVQISHFARSEDLLFFAKYLFPEARPIASAAPANTRCGPAIAQPPLIHGAVSFRDGTYRADVAAAGKVYRRYRWHTQPAAEGREALNLRGGAASSLCFQLNDSTTVEQ